MICSILLTEENYQAVYDLLPDSFHEVASIIGTANTIKLFNEKMGTWLPIGKRSKTGSHKELALLIGDKSAERLSVAFWQARGLHIPFCRYAKIALRNKQMNEEYIKLLTEKKAITSTQAMDILSKKYAMTARNVCRIVNKY